MPVEFASLASPSARRSASQQRSHPLLWQSVQSRFENLSSSAAGPIYRDVKRYDVIFILGSGDVDDHCRNGAAATDSAFVPLSSSFSCLHLNLARALRYRWSQLVRGVSALARALATGLRKSTTHWPLLVSND
ncbi:hypothetical protein MPTK1_7g05630 [Marchantia polymorpha subsp. ruderalis]|uniref:Uncharacterized protein n=2 Tax=Marchantia polymorpha TaxID=3197 RepID=A0AAF6BWG7_MARPO|nr:hypothetical protein MARPO_0057s0108 [Marchantia polymorpha]BBN16351.1 hypothetical protein Mp_7g05630 [Marchantia polymorpha subsp. ruderalis]|eukprot:PTQ37507.1 hypothetical protein MARPO_0057s0108 [Marchantia polymorpha]